MTAPAPTMGAVTADRRLLVAGTLAIAGAIVAAIARRLGWLALGWTVLVVVVAGSVALGLLVRFVGRRATATERARTATRIATLALGFCGLAVAIALPALTRASGWPAFAADIGALLVGVAVLFLLAAPGRTMGWRVLLGVVFLGFLVVPALARLVGEPVLARLGASDPLGHSLWVPVTENCLVLLVVLLIALITSRQPLRPAALDMMLVGAWTGFGFALSVDASIGRGGPNWSIAAPLSWMFPSAHGGSALGTWWFGAGYLVSAAAIGVGIGISVLYRLRFRWALLAAPIMFVVTVAEHAMNNLLTSGNHTTIATVLQVVTLGGTLSSFLLLGSAGWLAQIERIEPLGPALRHGVFLRPSVATERGRLLGIRQGAIDATDPQSGRS